MELLFEKSKTGSGPILLPECDVAICTLPAGLAREKELNLPELSENDISRHYTQLMKRTHGVNDGFYPLGSCTMKYNPKINDEMAGLEGFTQIHPLQPQHTVQGCLQVIRLAEQYLCEITGMDRMSLQPAAGAHGEFAGLLLMKAYHEGRGDNKRKKIIVPDSAHGTNPASATMVGYDVITIPSTNEGIVDLEKLRAVVGEDIAGLMLTNPNTVGIFDKNILEITKMIHDCGGLTYYDGANLNAIMGVTRPGDMGFDIIHTNLHKTFSTPHGGGGPGSGPVGCKAFLESYLPGPMAIGEEELSLLVPSNSIGRVRSFYGNFLVVVRALTYILTLGKEGIPKVSKYAVLNANYMRECLKDLYDMPYEGPCMHEFVMSLEGLKKETGVSAMDIAKSLLDFGMHPPTMYFPLIVHEALMIEPTETESKEAMDQAIAVFRELYEKAKEDAQSLMHAPYHTPVRRLDEVGAARKPVLKYCRCVD